MPQHSAGVRHHGRPATTSLRMPPAHFVRVLHALSNGLLGIHALAPDLLSADDVGLSHAWRWRRSSAASSGPFPSSSCLKYTYTSWQSAVAVRILSAHVAMSSAV